METKIKEIVQNTLHNLKYNYTSLYSAYRGYKKSLKLPEQRTEEWFKMREGKITGSECYICCGGTMFGKNFEKLIEEKTSKVEKKRYVGVAMKHGIMLENVAVKLYETLYGRLVLSSGFIVHPIYDYIGASTDGFVIDMRNLTGKCLEIKCPYSKRRLDSIPEYYIHQMQMQMEVNDIDECDYFACRIDKDLTFEDWKLSDKIKIVVMENYKGETFISDLYGVKSLVGIEPKVFDKEELNKKFDEIEIKSKDRIKKTYFCTVDEWFIKTIKRNKLWFENEALPSYEKAINIIRSKK